MNKSLKTFAQKLRMSVTFASNKAVEYINLPQVAELIADHNRYQLEDGEDANRKDLGDYGAWRHKQRTERGLQTWKSCTKSILAYLPPKFLIVL